MNKENSKKNVSVLKAIVVLYRYLGFDDPDIINDINHDYLSELTTRSGRDVVWYMDESNEACIYIDTLEFLSKEDIERELS